MPDSGLYHHATVVYHCDDFIMPNGCRRKLSRFVTLITVTSSVFLKPPPR